MKLFYKNKKKEEKKKGVIREWTDSIVFAVVVATLVRWLFIEAYTIPTPSMEKSMLVGDFLFVSKLHYGTRTPQTPLQVPLTHQTIWGTKIPSYSAWPQIPNFRLPGFSSIKRNDVVVFNWPAEKGHPADLKTNYIKRCVAIAGDTLQIINGQVYINGQATEQPPKLQYTYSFISQQQFPDEVFERLNIAPHANPMPINGRMVATNYTRLGDGTYFYLVDAQPQQIQEIEKMPEVSQLRIFENSQADINFRIFPHFSTNENLYYLKTDNPLPEQALRLMQIYPPDVPGSDYHLKVSETTGGYFVTGSDKNMMALNNANLVEAVVKLPKGIHTQNKKQWNRDNLGPIVLPKKGMSIEINPQTLHHYGPTLLAYENLENAEWKGNQLLVNGAPLVRYTFQQDYYFMMGDNRHNSQDSRYWGFVPEDHIVGKAWLIWMSLDPTKGIFDGKIRWNRFFKLVE